MNDRPMTFTLYYWQDDGWYVGRLKGVRGIFSQAETLQVLEVNIRGVYGMLTADKSLADDLGLRMIEKLSLHANSASTAAMASIVAPMANLPTVPQRRPKKAALPTATPCECVRSLQSSPT